jgi:hypothetical protein
MFCEDCINSGYFQAMSIGECKVCGKDTPSPHLPSYSVCSECAIEFDLCEQCGKNLHHEE